MEAQETILVSKDLSNGQTHMDGSTLEPKSSMLNENLDFSQNSSDAMANSRLTGNLEVGDISEKL